MLRFLPYPLTGARRVNVSFLSPKLVFIVVAVGNGFLVAELPSLLYTERLWSESAVAKPNPSSSVECTIEGRIGSELYLVRREWIGRSMSKNGESKERDCKCEHC